MNARRRRPPKARGIGDSLERAFGFVRQLIAERPPPRAPVPALPPATDLPGSVQALQEQERRLKRTVSSLEEQLDQMHAAMVSGTLPIPTSDAVRQYRRLRERLQDKALELTRLERQVAREHRLFSRDSEPPPAFAEPTPQSRDLEKRYEVAQRMLADGGLHGSRAERIAIEDRVRFLFDPDPDTRRAAAAEVVERAPSLAVDLLGLVVDDPNARVRLAALNALSMLGPESGAWMIFERLLRDSNVQVRVGALRGLATAVPERSFGFVLKALEDVEPEVRRGAVMTLGWLRDRRCIEPLLFALRDVDPSVRTTALDTLGSFGDDRSVLSLVRMVADPIPEVAAEAWTALRSVLAQDLPEAAAELPPEEAAASLEAWWARARVDRMLGDLADGKRRAVFRRVEVAAPVQSEAPAAYADEEMEPPPAYREPEVEPAVSAESLAEASFARPPTPVPPEPAADELESVEETLALDAGAEVRGEPALESEATDRAAFEEKRPDVAAQAGASLGLSEEEEALSVSADDATAPAALAQPSEMPMAEASEAAVAAEQEIGIEGDVEAGAAAAAAEETTEEATDDALGLGLDTDSEEEEGLGLDLDTEEEGDFLPLMGDETATDEEEGEEGEDEEYESLI